MYKASVVDAVGFGEENQISAFTARTGAMPEAVYLCQEPVNAEDVPIISDIKVFDELYHLILTKDDCVEVGLNA